MNNTIQVGDKSFSLYIKSEQINVRIQAIAAQINAAYKDKCPVFIGVLNGSFLFIADLIREISTPCEVSFIKISSYSGTGSTGTIKKAIGLPDRLQGRDIIIVEDIVDTGFTMQSVLEDIYQQSPGSVSICTLLYKPAALLHEVKELRYIGFEIPNDFVVGYGLDYDGLGRNLRDIYCLSPNPDSLP